MTDEAERMIRKLHLNAENRREYRKRWIDILQLAREVDPRMYRELMGFPADLPDLSQLEPWENTRPEGVTGSYYAQRARGDLPETYD